jgi:hypothetical protein
VSWVRVIGMSGNLSDALAPRSCQPRDLSALIGLLAVLEGELMTGEVSRYLSGRIRDRLEQVELLETGGTERDLRQALNDLNHRLRYALGEYDEPPRPLAVPE